MPSPTHTPARNRDNSQGEERAARPGRDYDQSLLWKDVRQAVLFITAFVTIGGGVTVFLTMPTHAQAMIAYGAVVTLCVSGIVACLRRRSR